MREEQVDIIRPWNWERVRGFVLPVLVIVLVGFVVLAFATGGDDAGSLTSTGSEAHSGPAVVEPVGETGFSRVILTERAAERLDIQTVSVRELDVDGELRLVIPYSAVIYGLHGETWAYLTLEPLTYVREPITVDYIKDDTVFLLEGPTVGTEVVTVGVAELYGTETGVGK
jgi:hypothetical protein